MPCRRPIFRTQRRQRRRAQTGGDYPPILNAEREPYDTKFSYAIRRQDIQTLERLVARNARLVNERIEIPDENNEENNEENEHRDVDNPTPLHLAIILGHLPVVKFLVERGASFSDYTGFDGYNDATATEIAVEEGNPIIIDYLIDTAPYEIIWNIVYKYESNPTDNNFNLIKKVLQSPNFDINKPSKMYFAGNTIVSFFTMLCIDLDDDELDTDVISAMLNAGAHINGNPDDFISPLTALCRNYDDIDLIAFMIENGANVNGTDSEDSTPLIDACKHNTTEIADYLVSRGADINKTDKEGNTCIHAAVTNSKDMIQWAIDKGVDIHKNNNLGQTPLHTALKQSDYQININIIHILLENGIHINAVDNEGHTPLYIFISSRKTYYSKTSLFNNLKYLLAGGAHITPDIIAAATLPEVKEYLEMAAKTWKGFTKGDFEKFNTIFDTENPANMKNVSVCPVCLKYVERSEACNYMGHNCSTDGYAHKELYNKYKNAEGLIKWCTICGRICKGHNHYPLTAPDAPVPDVIIGRDPFAPDCRVDGGGGVEEKIMRFRAMREYAAELQSQVTKIPHETAMNELVEAMWLPGNMPRVAKRIMNTRAFNTPLNVFPNRNADATAANGAPPAAAVVAPPGIFEAPNVSTEPGENAISADDSQPVIEFNHRTNTGVDLLTHSPVNKDSVVEIIGHKGPHTDFDCFEADCGGVLWPEEIRLAFDNPAISGSITEHDREALQNYTERFNAFFATHPLPYRNAAAGGGADITNTIEVAAAPIAATDVFQPALNAVCAVPPRPRGGAKRTTKRWKHARILTAYKKKVRRAAKTRVRK